MKTIPRTALDALAQQLSQLSSATQSVIRATVESTQWATVAELREALIAALEPILGAAADAAAGYAAEFYDLARELCLGEAYGATAQSGRNPEATAGAVRALVGQVPDKGIQWLIERLLERADQEIRKAADNCVIANGQQDPADVRYARVPKGPDPCWWCCMIASNGFVYKSPDSARTHAHCHCIVVPGFEGITEVEGYDEQHYADLFYKAVDEGETSIERLMELSEKAKRDRRDEEALSASRQKYEDLRRIRGYLESGASVPFTAPAPGGGSATFRVGPMGIMEAVEDLADRLGFTQGHEDELVYEIVKRSRGHSFKDVDPERGLYSQDVRFKGLNGDMARVELRWGLKSGMAWLVGTRIRRMGT